MTNEKQINKNYVGHDLESALRAQEEIALNFFNSGSYQVASKLYESIYQHKSPISAVSKVPKDVPILQNHPCMLSECYRRLARKTMENSAKSCLDSKRYVLAEELYEKLGDNDMARKCRELYCEKGQR